MADALIGHGVEVRHIMSATKTEVAQLNPAAVVCDEGVLTYPAT